MLGAEGAVTAEVLKVRFGSGGAVTLLLRR